MSKFSILLIILLTVVLGCGKSSKIKVHVEARALGDGMHIPFNIVVPLTENSISSFQSPIKDLNPLFKGFVGSLMNIGATIGAGKQRLSVTQPIPEFSDEYLGSLKVKRIFFYIESDNEDKENFDFLRRLLVKISSAKMPRDDNSWDPKIETGSMKQKDLSFFREVLNSKPWLRGNGDKQAEKWEDETSGLFMIKYIQEKQKETLVSDQYGAVNIIETDTPNLTRKYLEQNYSSYFTRLHMLKKSILVELKKDPVIEEMFKVKLSSDAKKIEELGIGEIRPCDNKVCLDLHVPDQNLLPILRAGNAVKIETFIDPKRNPKSFQLKGFIEFEVKIKSNL